MDRDVGMDGDIDQTMDRDLDMEWDMDVSKDTNNICPRIRIGGWGE